MLAEAYHYAADTGSELLLLLGMRRSRRSPDRLHPFGHGKVLYFYSLLVAVFIFVVGGVLATREGIHRFRRPELPEHPVWNYCFLGFAGICELYSWQVSRKELMKQKSKEESTWQLIQRSKDPTVFFSWKIRQHCWDRGRGARHSQSASVSPLWSESSLKPMRCEAKLDVLLKTKGPHGMRPLRNWALRGWKKNGASIFGAPFLFSPTRARID